MRGLAASFTRIAAAALFILGTDAGAVTFDDGLVHVIDAGNSYPFEQVLVYDGPGASSTTAELLDGGEIGSGLLAFDSSIVRMSGGVITGNLVAQDSSEIFFPVERSVMLGSALTAIRLLKLPAAISRCLRCEITDLAGHPVIVMRQGEPEDRSDRAGGATQPLEINGGPPGTRTLDHRVKRTNQTQEVTRTYSSCLASDCNRLHR